MPPVRKNNMKRTELRDQCRKQLSQHIQSKLRITIDPSQVRLIPRVNDPYRWDFIPEKKHLFSKNLSEHSTGAYEELCQGIDAYNEGNGAVFEAIPAPSVRIADFNSTKGAINIPSKTAGGYVSFSVKIDQLQEENAKLAEELKIWKERAVVESKQKEHVEEELKQLREINLHLEGNAQKNARDADYFQTTLSWYVERVNEILPVLQELQTEGPEEKLSA